MALIVPTLLFVEMTRASPVAPRENVIGASPFERHRLLENRRTQSSSCSDLLSSKYISAFEESMKPCSCSQLDDGRYRIECKYDYCEHCIGSTCAVQQTVDIYSPSGSMETGFLCVTYTSGEAAGDHVCYEFGRAAEAADEDLFCSVEVNGRNCPTCSYDTCNGFTQPRVECGDELTIDNCDSTVDMAIPIGSPLAMFRADFTFGSCYLEGAFVELKTDAPTSSPSKGPTTVQPSQSPVKKGTLQPSKSPTRMPTPQPSLSPLLPSSVPVTVEPSLSPVTAEPSLSPVTVKPSLSPATDEPTLSPLATRTLEPSLSPTRVPTPSPSSKETRNPTALPTTSPVLPTQSPTGSPTLAPETSSPTYTPYPTEGPTTARFAMVNKLLSGYTATTSLPTAVPIPSKPTMSPIGSTSTFPPSSLRPVLTSNNDELPTTNPTDFEDPFANVQIQPPETPSSGRAKRLNARFIALISTASLLYSFLFLSG